MKPIRDLTFGFNDAKNYGTAGNQQLFQKFFLCDEHVDAVCNSNTFFLVGEKGTGKTAYSVYLSNDDYKNYSSKTVFMQDTDYLKFVQLKKENKLLLSDYVDIWKVIIFLLIAEKVSNDEGKGLFSAIKFKNLRAAIDQFYLYAFNPEIHYAIQFIEQSRESAKLLFDCLQMGTEGGTQLSFTETRFQNNLLFIQKRFEEALASINLQKNHILFIDGIDQRPSHVEYSDYLECVKGLANAIWSLNSGFFPNIKNSTGKMKVVLLTRPDILDAIGLHNLNNKLRDNSILLDWRTTYKDYRNSMLFRMADQMLRVQQDDANLVPGQCWDHYFPYKVFSQKTQRESDSSFILFLRYSFYRPRDIVSLLDIMLRRFLPSDRPSYDVFRASDFEDGQTQKEYANYLLGEIKDSLSFYYEATDYELFLKFFEYLNRWIDFRGKTFRYDNFLTAYDSLMRHIDTNKFRRPVIFESADTFLQFLFELNVVCYIESGQDTGTEFLRWCFRERSYANIRPKVRTHQRYKMHYGIARALNTGIS